MTKLCPRCGASLINVIEGYLCYECGGGLFSEDEVITPKCPVCGNELSDFPDNSYYCYSCSRSFSKDAAVPGETLSDDEYGFDEPDYDSMINNGDAICLNCTFWSTSPYGASYGMVCRKGYSTSGPADSCCDFVQSHYFASYGDNGQYQFDETARQIQNKLYHWKNNR